MRSRKSHFRYRSWYGVDDFWAVGTGERQDNRGRSILNPNDEAAAQSERGGPSPRTRVIPTAEAGLNS